MPPKPKYTKEQIITAALQIVREKGIVGKRIMKGTIGIIGNILFDFLMSFIGGLIFCKIWGTSSFLICYVAILTIIFAISDFVNYVMSKETLRMIR